MNSSPSPLLVPRSRLGQGQRQDEQGEEEEGRQEQQQEEHLPWPGGLRGEEEEEARCCHHRLDTTEGVNQKPPWPRRTCRCLVLSRLNRHHSLLVPRRHLLRRRLEQVRHRASRTGSWIAPAPQELVFQLHRVFTSVGRELVNVGELFAGAVHLRGASSDRGCGDECICWRKWRGPFSRASQGPHRTVRTRISNVLSG